MYEAAYRSQTYGFRKVMMKILEKVVTPPASRIQKGWVINWRAAGGIFLIDAGRLGCFAQNLKKLKWAEELKVIEVYFFVGTKRPDATITMGGEIVSQNQWVFDQVTKIVYPGRIRPMCVPSSFRGPRDVVYFDPMTDPPTVTRVLV